ncbi:MAG: tRNA guanosine(34) transglycosylase Tgt [bacterium]|nr:tRNA guanosine(34) transglycosylase Tgt [bacterium]
MGFSFQILAQDAHSAARIGRLRTPHGIVHTPAFMPVGTRAAVKTLTPNLLTDLGAEIILGNTYHLHVRPGASLIASLGGLHRFMAWPRPILTDSGGFQVFSLADLRNVTDEGVTFQSHIDGTRLFIGPREAIQIQHQLGADIIMTFDECPPATAPRSVVADAVARTTRWARICLEEHQHAYAEENQQALFAIVQGGTFDDLRRRCVDELLALDFPGYAIGGVAVGEPQEEIERITALCAELLPQDRPRYLMGVGRPEDILGAVQSGIDLFDCVLPTRNARNGEAITADGDLPIKAGRFKDDPNPVQPGCTCYTCRTFSRAYLRHLFNVGESLGGMLLTIHNVHFYLQLMADIRAAISSGTLSHYATQLRERRAVASVPEPAP